MKRRAAYLIPVFMGVLFYFYYIRTASSNVAFSDYIRLINSYLPDVGNPAKFFVPDILTRVPVTYLGRIVNVKLFQYNTFFDTISQDLRSRKLRTRIRRYAPYAAAQKTRHRSGSRSVPAHTIHECAILPPKIFFYAAHPPDPQEIPLPFLLETSLPVSEKSRKNRRLSIKVPAASHRKSIKTPLAKSPG